MGIKNATRERIIESAKALFLEKSISAVSMGDIARSAACTRRTLYRHFAAKEDLIYETVIRLLEEWNIEQKAAFDSVAGSGLERLGGFLQALADRLEDRKRTLVLMGEFDFVFRDDLGYRPDTETANRFAKAAGLTETLMGSLIRDGISDGSVTQDVNPGTVVPTISAVLWGTAERAAIRDRLMREEFGMSGAQLLRTQIDLYVRSLQA